MLCCPQLPCLDRLPPFPARRCRGFDGDGRTCKPNKKAMSELMDVFWFEEEGLGCSPGKDVEWPAAAPGELPDARVGAAALLLQLHARGLETC